ncbi:MAG: enoyl-ACP reductase [Thermaerobacter sp.]|nr:enoyl-ACP reductase [Thermaerobacter sp.]
MLAKGAENVANEPGSRGLLAGRRALVMGVANKRSLAWGIAQAFAREGADLALSYRRDRVREHLGQWVQDWPAPPLLVPCDVMDDASVAEMSYILAREWGGVDAVVHSIAHAQPGDLAGRFVDTSREGWQVATETSAYSLALVARACLPLWEARGGGSLLAMSYIGADRVVPNYNVMGVAKAALEASVRYLASDLGPSQVRVNAISAGPLKTLAATGVQGFSSLLHQIADRSPLQSGITIDDVGNAAVFLASDWARRITGQVLFVDAGYHVTGV